MTALHDPPTVRGRFVMSAHGCTAVAIDDIAVLQVDAIGVQGDLGLVAYYRLPISVQATPIGGAVRHEGLVLQVFPVEADRDVQSERAKAALAALVDRIDLADLEICELTSEPHDNGGTT